jgi:HTH-type transcriptional regulator/antitoxin HipB
MTPDRRRRQGERQIMPRIRTPIDVGSLIRSSRQDKHLTLEELAERAGVSRRWLIQVEHGHPRAELSHILRVFEALEIAIEAQPGSSPRVTSTSAPRRPNPDLDRHLASFDEAPPSTKSEESIRWKH